MVQRVRPPAVAGSFYPSDSDELRTMVDELLAAARRARVEVDPGSVKAVVVPHAGYVYSGPVAAVGYELLERARDRIERVVLMGPVHRVPVRGISLPDADAFRTPLGDARVEGVPHDLPGPPEIQISEAVHAPEHSLEVQFPFLQTVLPDVPVIPLLALGAEEQAAEALDALWGGPETVIIISSDLSHYLPYAEAVRTDAETLAEVLALRQVDHDRACGATPVNALTRVAARRGLRPTLVAACNSGDTAGTHDRVVGYAAIAYQEQR